MKFVVEFGSKDSKRLEVIKNTFGYDSENLIRKSLVLMGIIASEFSSDPNTKLIIESNGSRKEIKL